MPRTIPDRLLVLLGYDRGPAGPLAGLRIRQKLIALHTLFTLLLTGVLLVALRPAVDGVVRSAEAQRADDALQLRADAPPAGPDEAAGPDGAEGLRIRRGPASMLGLRPADVARALDLRAPITVRGPAGWTTRLLVTPPPTDRLAGPASAAQEPQALVVSARLPGARAAATRVYALVVASMIVLYALVAVSLEVFVLPRHVYSPIRTMLRAERAVQAGDQRNELVPESMIPNDEIGEIMRSRNESMRALRRQEAELAVALSRLEHVAADLRLKNHRLENARRNLEGADRLASIGMMSAGIAHELNTPLAVAKGLVEKLAKAPAAGLPDSEAQLLRRVVGRLERLSEGLLDFARARSPSRELVPLPPLVDEAFTLVRLDRRAAGVALRHEVPAGFAVWADADRMLQVVVNLVRNAVDAFAAPRPGGPSADARAPADPPCVVVRAAPVQRDGADWTLVTVQDNGPGIDPAILPVLFEPFASTRLDAHGTGLGLAVVEGIVTEHGGVIVARGPDTPGRTGAVFEILLPQGPPGHAPPAPEAAPAESEASAAPRG